MIRKIDNVWSSPYLFGMGYTIFWSFSRQNQNIRAERDLRISLVQSHDFSSMKLEFRERKYLVQTDPSCHDGFVPRAPWLGYWARGCSAHGSWIDGALGMGYSGTQLWGLQWCCTWGACSDNRCLLCGARAPATPSQASSWLILFQSALITSWVNLIGYMILQSSI